MEKGEDDELRLRSSEEEDAVDPKRAVDGLERPVVVRSGSPQVCAASVPCVKSPSCSVPTVELEGVEAALDTPLRGKNPRTSLLRFASRVLRKVDESARVQSLTTRATVGNRRKGAQITLGLS